MSKIAVVMTNALKITSVDQMIRALPTRSAMTPPKGNRITTGMAWAASTMLREVGVAPGSASTPNAKAMGAMPLPMLLIVRATSNRWNAGRETTLRVPDTPPA